MAASKRKSLERKKVTRAQTVRGLGVLPRVFLALFGLISRYPRLIGGVAVFGVVYSFVAANALWYQHGVHPSPFMVTRTAGPRPVADANAGVTTFRIERQTAPETGAGNQPSTKSSELVRAVQAALAARGLYEGPADGMTGPKTTSAIIFYAETEGLDSTGTATPALLARLKTRASSTPVQDKSDITASVLKNDPVAGLIRQSDVKPPVDTALVMKIQKGLQKTYDGVTPDGILGEQTRVAIRNFEKHYHLPVTGEPSVAVLKKLQAIGAL